MFCLALVSMYVIFAQVYRESRFAIGACPCMNAAHLPLLVNVAVAAANPGCAVLPCGLAQRTDQPADETGAHSVSLHDQCYAPPRYRNVAFTKAETAVRGPRCCSGMHDAGEGRGVRGARRNVRRASSPRVPHSVCTTRGLASIRFSRKISISIYTRSPICELPILFLLLKKGEGSRSRGEGYTHKIHTKSGRNSARKQKVEPGINSKNHQGPRKIGTRAKTHVTFIMRMRVPSPLWSASPCVGLKFRGLFARFASRVYIVRARAIRGQ